MVEVCWAHIRAATGGGVFLSPRLLLEECCMTRECFHQWSEFDFFFLCVTIGFVASTLPGITKNQPDMLLLLHENSPTV